MKQISPENRMIFSQIEGTDINPIQIALENSENYKIELISGELPKGIIFNEENNCLEGKLELVSETTIYYFTFKATDLDTNETFEKWYSAEVITLNTEWDNNNITDLQIYEKQFFQYQYNLINPEGNEVFKKISGEFPVGLTLSETGLLYGIPEEDREDLYYFRIGVYRGEKVIYETPSDDESLFSIKVKDISELNIPVWITDAGILDYIDYEVEKNLQVIAHDFKNRKVYYEIGDYNLPKGILWTTEGEDCSLNTGKLYGICQTKISKDDWFFNVRPYVIENGVKIYGEEREFILISNALEDDDLITWITESLEPVKIGYSYTIKIEAKSGNKIIFSLASGKLPDGLQFNKNGEIYGTVNYQDLGNYEFFVKAYTSNAFSIKKFVLTVEKGLSVNALNTYLYINKEYQKSFQEILMPYDRTSAYNSSNTLYKIPTTPRIDIATLNTWDNVLLKYKFEKFNTPIDIYAWETKKKSLPNYDFFYKSIDESNKISENIKLKKHSNYKEYTEFDDNPAMNDDALDRFSNETIQSNQFRRNFRPGYIRNSIDESEVKVIYEDLDGNKITDSSEMEDFRTGKINDHEYIYYDVNNETDKIQYYYTNLETNDSFIIKKPINYPFDNIFDYAWFGRKFVFVGKEKVYITEVSQGRYYEIDSKKIVKQNEPIYIKIETLLTGEEIISKYILKDDEEILVEALKENTYVSYDPTSDDSDEYIIDPKSYNKIMYEENLDNYYYFDSPTITFRTASINGIREIFALPINVSKYEGNVLYKIGNQEIIDRTKIKQYYNITIDENGLYYAEFDNENGDKSAFYIYHKINDNEYKEVYHKLSNGTFEPLIQKELMLEGKVDYNLHTIYKKGSNIPFSNAIFNFPDGRKYICEKCEDGYSYAWFELKEMENPYIYYAEDNQSYGYPKDIVLPNVTDDVVIDGQVKFLDIDEEKNLLPDYMEKEYMPIIPLFCAIPYSHDTVLKNINAKEKEGNYWYGRKFIFYEIHFEPKYRDADTFTIDFYNHVNENSPEFQLI